MKDFEKILDTKSGELFQMWIEENYGFFIYEYNTIHNETRELVDHEIYFKADECDLPWSMIYDLAVRWLRLNKIWIETIKYEFVGHHVKLRLKGEDGWADKIDIGFYEDTEMIEVGVREAFEFLEKRPDYLNKEN